MGPISLFDKSFLQSISLDEAVWFDRFFMPVACPIFFVETLADLGKDASKRGSAEFSVVKDIAQKFPEMGGSPCAFHADIATQDLLGNHMPLDGRIPRSGGRPVPKGVVYDLGPEERAFNRWQKGEFFEVEKVAAAAWRKSLSELDLNKVASELRSVGIDGKSCNSLDQARDMALAVVSHHANAMSVLALAVTFLHVPQHLHRPIIEAWRRDGKRPLNVYAPYAAHVVAVEVFFQFALAAHLIDSNRPSNRTDIAYLFYLPFSTLFISSDKLHRRTASLFMRGNQEFVWGIDLKASLKAVNSHFLTFPEEVKEQGVMSFADAPPDGNIVADLWDRHLRPGIRNEKKEPRDANPERDAELVKKLKEFSKQPTLPGQQMVSEENMEMMSIEHSVHRKRGSWWQVPKDMPDEKDE
ncbi:hypothetical protein [Bradyrhizobium sp. CCBAU 11434]|uniref:hypothetical protein n=1 Tax=Bradyrhizobium sp. CCBAU 11434 TaxID=1630885 RepID=UPI002306728D|nr:hypothetical protein [Bradyrhizobium sp. CCBAU 11434]